MWSYDIHIFKDFKLLMKETVITEKIVQLTAQK